LDPGRIEDDEKGNRERWLVGGADEGGEGGGGGGNKGSSGLKKHNSPLKWGGKTKDTILTGTQRKAEYHRKGVTRWGGKEERKKREKKERA